MNHQPAPSSPGGHRHALLASAAATALLSLPATASLAQQEPVSRPAVASVGIEEIVVTARKRAEKLQQVPIAVSAFSGAQLERHDVQSVMDLSSIVPNFQAPRNTVSFSAPQFYLRGAGRANNNWNAENAVAVFVDDIYLQSTAAAYIDQIDFERVEVLRGPQGTLYGRNATVGAIKFIPRKPDLEEPHYDIDLTAGSHNRNDAKGYLTVPVIKDKLAIKLDAYHTANDGNMTEVDAANKVINTDVAKTEHYGARLSSLWHVIDHTEFELNLDAFKQNDGVNLMTPIAPTDPTSLAQLLSKNGSSDFQPIYGVRRGSLEPLTAQGGFNRTPGSHYSGYGVVFKGTVDTPIGSLKSITGFRSYFGDFVGQLSSQASRSTIFGVTIGSTVDAREHYNQFTQELQLTGVIFNKIKYTGGLYYFSNQWKQLEYGSAIGVPVEYSPVMHSGYAQSYGGSYQNTDLDARSYAAYVDASWEVWNNISIIAGARQTWDTKAIKYDSLFEDNVTHYAGFPVNSSKTYQKFTPRVGLTWQATTDILFYGTYSEGYKAGDLAGDRATSPGPATLYLQPETVSTVEAGVKAEWFEHKLRTNITGFTSKLTNHADLISPQTVALSDQRIKGLELETNWSPIRSLQFYGNLGLLDARYLRADANSPIFAPDFTGYAPGLKAKPVSSPAYSFSLGVDYDQSLGESGSLSWNASMSGVASQFNGLGVANYDSERVPAYAVTDIAVTYRTSDKRISVTSGISNLLDKTYWTTGFFGSVPEFSGRAYADGRTWFVKVGYKY